MNDTSRRRPAQDLQRRPAATASDIGDPTRRVDTQRTDQRFIDGREHRFHASELGAPFLAASGGPVGSCGALVHNSKFNRSSAGGEKIGEDDPRNFLEGGGERLSQRRQANTGRCLCRARTATRMWKGWRASTEPKASVSHFQLLPPPVCRTHDLRLVPETYWCSDCRTSGRPLTCCGAKRASFSAPQVLCGRFG